jgi:HK97 family phage major capsid protein
MFNMIDPLRASLVTVQAGAQFLTGLVGNISIPTYAGTTALWKGENETAVDGAGATGSLDMSPKRLTTFITISKQFLLQDSAQAESLLMSDIVKSVQGKLEATIFGKENVSSTQPLGFFYATPSINGTATWANIVGLETAVDTANALTTAKYITNAAGRGILKKTVKVANMPSYLLGDDGMMNGYPVLVTNHVASALQSGQNEYGIVFGDWSQLLIGQWGGFDLTVDPYTAAKTGEVVVTINAYFDAIQRRTESFKTGSIK